MHKTFVTLFASLFLCAVTARAQTSDNPKPPDQSDDVLRINTELVQTDVMVFDKQGRFVKDLKRENFELRVDGKPRPIGFFDRVQAGDQRGNTVGGGAGNITPPAPVRMDRRLWIEGGPSSFSLTICT